jgi:hypothetical protein
MRGIVSEVHLVAASHVPSDRRREQRECIAEDVDPGVLVPQDPVVGDRRETIRIADIEIDPVAAIVSHLVAGDPQGGGRIRAAVGEEESIRLVVRDTGPLERPARRIQVDPVPLILQDLISGQANH